MKEKKMHISGLAALNTGTIVNCYSAVRLKAKESVSGLCAENKGQIHNSMYRGKLSSGKHPSSGLVGLQRGTLRHCFWIRGKRDSDEKKYTDLSFSYLKSDFKDRDNWPEVISHWDMVNTWHCEDGVFELYDNRKNPEGYDNIVEISSREDLYEFASAVNEGRASARTLYRLTKDIDLGGKEWTPIGTDPHTAFTSIFDGTGHTIKNFRINASKYPYAGLFGWSGNSASILNLTADCVITKKGNCAAPLCAVNKGTIYNCIARSKYSISRYVGGLVAQNEGNISNSCALGEVLYPIIPWWLGLLAPLLLALLLALAFFLNSQGSDGPEIFAPVIIDPNAKPIENDIPTPSPDEITSQNATFIMNTEMTVSTANYAGAIGLNCPTWSVRGFVATVRVTQADLAAHGIQTEDEFTTVYKSGLICPGYGVDIITLSSLPDGSKLPAGTYEFSVLFDFYNIETNEKAAIDSVVPLKVTIT